MSPSQAQSDDQAAQASLQADIAALQESISRAQQTIRQIQNANGQGVGNTTPARTKSGITIPAVSALAATVSGNVAGQTNLQVTWVDAPSPLAASIDHYNVYTTQAFTGQGQPTLIGASKASPFVGTFQPQNNVSTNIIVQTVLSNGQSLRLADCPTTTVMGVSPKKSVLSYLLGFLPQSPAQLAVTTTGVNNVLTASSGNGGVLISVAIANNGLGSVVSHSSNVGLKITIDGSAATYLILANGTNQDLSGLFTAGCAKDANNVRTKLYGVGFQTSCVIDVTSSGGASFSGALTVTADYGLKL